MSARVSRARTEMSILGATETATGGLARSPLTARHAAVLTAVTVAVNEPSADVTAVTPAGSNAPSAVAARSSPTAPMPAGARPVSVKRSPAVGGASGPARAIGTASTSPAMYWWIVQM